MTQDNYERWKAAVLRLLSLADKEQSCKYGFDRYQIALRGGSNFLRLYREFVCGGGEDSPCAAWFFVCGVISVDGYFSAPSVYLDYDDVKEIVDYLDARVLDEAQMKEDADIEQLESVVDQVCEKASKGESTNVTSD